MSTPEKPETPKRTKIHLTHVERHVALGLVKRRGIKPELLAAAFGVSFDVARKLVREAQSMPDFVA